MLLYSVLLSFTSDSFTHFQLSVYTCLMPDNSPLNLALKIDSFDPHSAFERWVWHVDIRAIISCFLAVHGVRCWFCYREICSHKDKLILSIIIEEKIYLLLRLSLLVSLICAQNEKFVLSTAKLWSLKLTFLQDGECRSAGGDSRQWHSVCSGLRP